MRQDTDLHFQKDVVIWFLSSLINIEPLFVWLDNLTLALKDLPDKLIFIVIILFLGCLLFKAWLKYKKHMAKIRAEAEVKKEEELTKRIQTIMEASIKLGESQDRLSMIKALCRRKTTPNDNDELIKYINEMNPKESTPVCEERKSKQISFPKKNEKRSK